MRLPYSHTAIVLAFTATLLALPACNNYEGPGLGIRASNDRVFRFSQNNLKQIGLAMHNIHDATGTFPVGHYTADGKIGLSWRVAILPYIEQQALYLKFKLDEPWDSEHNKKLIQYMPSQYTVPGDEKANGTTYYRSFSGSGALMYPMRQLPQPVPGALVRGPRVTDIADGTSNTAMVVEAAEPVIWTKPDDLEFNPSGSPPALGGIFREGANILLCDASVYFLNRKDFAPDLLKALITINGNEAVQLPRK